MASAVALGAGLQARAHGLAYKWIVLIVVIFGLFMSVLDQTVVNVALPHVIAVFNADIHQAQLVVTGYALALAIIIPATGYLMDTYGGKRVWILSLAAFTLGSALCAFSWNIQALVFFRVLQGLGGGMLMPLGMAMIYRVVPPEERGMTMGLLGVPVLFAPAIGPSLGGYLVEFVDWRTIFLINLPVGVLGIGMAAALLRELPTRSDLTFDMAGFITACVAFGASLIALSNGPTDGWTAPYVLVLLAVSVVAFAAWIVVELRVPDPLLDLRLFADFQFTMGMVVTFVVTVAMFGTVFLLPLFMQNLRGLGAYETGLLLLPQGITAAVFMPIGGKLFDRLGIRPLMFVGLPLLAGMTYIFASLDVTTPDIVTVLVLMGRGVCMGLIFMPLNTAVMNRVPFDKINRGSSLSNAVRQLFASFGVAIVATILTNRQTFHQAILAERVTSGSPMVQRMLAAAGGVAAQNGWTPDQAKQLLLAMLNGQVLQRAAVLSFDDTFLVLAVMALVALLPALFLRTSIVAGAHQASMPVEM